MRLQADLPGGIGRRGWQVDRGIATLWPMLGVPSTSRPRAAAARAWAWTASKNEPDSSGRFLVNVDDRVSIFSPTNHRNIVA